MKLHLTLPLFTSREVADGNPCCPVLFRMEGRRGWERKPPFSSSSRNPLNSNKSMAHALARPRGCNLRAAITLFISRGWLLGRKPLRARNTNSTFASFELGEDGIYFPSIFYSISRTRDEYWITVKEAFQVIK